MPNNYYKIQHKKFYTQFDKVLYQRWNFFAPPPKSNFRLYFEYKSADSSVVYHKLEVMKNLLKDKSDNAPFNSYEEMMDYQLYGCVNVITALLADLTKQSQYVVPDSTGTYHARKSIEKYNSEYTTGPEFQSLKRYAKLCASNLNFLDQIKNPELRITISIKDIPPFSSQLNYTQKDETPIPETLVYKSEFTTLK